MIQLDQFPQRETGDVHSSGLPRAEAALELELSPDDLLTLSSARPMKSPTPALVHSPVGPRTTVAGPAGTSMRRLATRPQWRPATRFGLALGAVLAAVGMTMAMHHHSIPTHPHSGAIDPVAVTTARIAPLSQPASEGAPVRFRNPFDRREVFTFPPGTSLANARDQVADVLIKRAHERLSHQPHLARSRRAHAPLMATQSTSPPSLPSL